MIKVIVIVSSLLRDVMRGQVFSRHGSIIICIPDAPLLENSQREDNDKSDSDDNTSDRNE